MGAKCTAQSSPYTGYGQTERLSVSTEIHKYERGLRVQTRALYTKLGTRWKYVSVIGTFPKSIETRHKVPIGDRYFDSHVIHTYNIRTQACRCTNAHTFISTSNILRSTSRRTANKGSSAHLNENQRQPLTPNVMSN